MMYWLKKLVVAGFADFFFFPTDLDCNFKAVDSPGGYFAPLDLEANVEVF